MKLLLIVLILGFSLNADEMKRIEAIVEDITKLRAEYNGCKTESKIYALQLKDERDKNKILDQEINSFKNLYKREIEYKNKIKKLENKIKVQDKLLKSKETYKKDLDIDKNIITKTKEKEKKTLKTKENTLESIVLVNCEEPNPFPKLRMKKEFVQADKKSKKVLKVKKSVVVKEKIEKFKASTFRLNKDSTIYEGIDGKVLDKWSIDTSFTSSIKTQNWIKITGYFIDKVWLRSSKDMWIKLPNATKR